MAFFKFLLRGEGFRGVIADRSDLAGFYVNRHVEANDAESARLAGPEIPRLGLLTRDELGQAFGRDALVNIGILNAGWAERLTTEHARLAGFRPAATTD